MRKLSLLRSGAFRFAILIAAIFAIGTVALLVQVEHSVTEYASEVAADSVAAEIAVLRDEDQSAGRPMMIQSITHREQVGREHQLRYLLVDRNGRRLAGSIPPTQARVGWHQLTLPSFDGEGEDERATIVLSALGVRLRDGSVLVVGSDSSDLEDLRQALGKSTVEFGIGISLLALLGGLVVGTIFLRRLERVNRAVERIMQGGIDERLPAIGMSIEFDHLTTNLNLMLHRIEGLMVGLRQVSTDIAHDLRTPLTRLRQRLESMKEGLDGSTPVTQQQIEAAIAQMDSILSIFQALLRISSLEAGAGKQRFVTVDLSEMLESVVQAYCPVAEDSQHALSSEIEPTVQILGDAALLTQAITNLIENALLHTPSGGHVTLSLKSIEDEIVIAVCDDGPGIPVAERGKVLDRFYRLDHSRNTAGAGLGLALVSAIATYHGARLSLEDNCPGLRVALTFRNRRDSNRLAA